VRRAARAPAWPALYRAWPDSFLARDIQRLLGFRDINRFNTLRDLARFRHQLGFDVLAEALLDGWQQGRFTLDELARCARAHRVASVLAPELAPLRCRAT
jgi:hypothetical protein